MCWNGHVAIRRGCGLVPRTPSRKTCTFLWSRCDVVPGSLVTIGGGLCVASCDGHLTDMLGFLESKWV